MNEQTQAAPAASSFASFPSDEVALALSVELLAAARRLSLHIDGCDGDQDAAHLLLTALNPLVERDDDADITLPAAALQRLLEGLVNALYSQQVSMRALRDAALAHLQHATAEARA